MKIKKIGNSSSYYTTCTHYMRSSDKFAKSMKIASRILSDIYPNCLLSFCEAMFPRIDSDFVVIEKLKVKIVTEKSKLHENRVYFSFII